MRLLSIVLRSSVLALSASALSGCLVTSVAGAAASAAGTAVGVTAKAASTTVHVGHVAVDAVTDSGGDNAAQNDPSGR